MEEPKNPLGSQDSPIDSASNELPSNVEKIDSTQRDLLRERFSQKAEADNIAPKADIEYIYDKILSLTIEEALEILNDGIDYHSDDSNFPFEVMDKLKLLVQGPEASGTTQDEWEFDVKAEAAVLKFHSPYPEVRAIADPYDDPTEPVETIRSWTLAVIWAIIGMGVNTFFAPRFPNITLNSQIMQLLLYPSGKFCEFVLPDWGFNAFGSRHSLNPGPWGYKEQMFATIAINVCMSTIYVYWNFQVQKLDVYFDGKYVTFGYEVLLTLSNQCLGFAFAGILRRFCVYPSKAIWPNILPTVAMGRALTLPEHKKESANGWIISRYKFFFISFAAVFVYYWIPGFLFTALSTFNWMTWIKPDNFNLANVTGSSLGLGFNPIPSFDWMVINMNFPFQSPFFAFIQQAIGTLIGGFVILGIYYSRRKWTSYIPINTSSIYANDGTPYQVTKVLNEDGTFNLEQYKNYSPPYYAAGNLVVYGAFFAFYPLNVVYMLINQWRTARDAFVGLYEDLIFDVKHSLGRSLTLAFYLITFQTSKYKELSSQPVAERPSMYDRHKDVHSVMMMQYPEAPDWWFLAVFVVAFIFGILCIALYPIHTPYWIIFFVIGLNAAYIVPMTLIYAISGVTEGLNVLTELIIGYALPGNAQALMFGKAFGYNINGQADTYVSDQKIAHYAKIPPRAVFRGQLITTILTSFASIGVMNWQFSNIKGLCHPDQEQNFTCANGSTVYYSAAVMWGSIGPKRVFGQLYPELQWCFLIGFLVAVVFLVGQRWGNKIREACRNALPSGVFKPLNATLFKFLSWFKIVNPSLICNGFLLWAPLNLTYMIPAVYVNYIFHYFIKRRFTAWWEKYTYVLAAALTGGTAFSALILFFAVQYHPKELSWWGNNVSGAGLDGGGEATLDTLKEGEYFGLRKGEFF